LLTANTVAGGHHILGLENRAVTITASGGVIINSTPEGGASRYNSFVHQSGAASSRRKPNVDRRLSRFSICVIAVVQLGIGPASVAADPTASASETRPLSAQVTEPTQPVSADAFVGTWEADMRDRDGVSYHEVLTLAKISTVRRSHGPDMGHANIQFTVNGEELSSVCDGEWWLAHERPSGRAALHIDGFDTGNGRRCIGDMTIMASSKNTMFVKYAHWPYPVGGFVSYRSTAASPPYHK
jgi:hypothetical protein